MTDEELQDKTRHYNALLREFGTRKSVFTDLNAEMPEDQRVEMKLLLEDIETEITRRQNEAQESPQTQL